MHLLATELNLKKGSMDLMVANAVVERKTRATMQSEVRTKELRKSRNLPHFPQDQKGKPKGDLDREGGEPTDNCAGFSDITIEDSMPKRTIGEQLQEMQDKADVISKLQRKL